MTSFIFQVLQEILERDKDISEYTFVLPSKRAGSFLLHELNRLKSGPVFSPKVISIEEFAEEVSELNTLDNLSALFEFYGIYKELTPDDEVEDFDIFSSWGQTLLHDFNEIDRYLVDPKPFFGYLSNIQEVNHWSLQDEKTDLMKSYLSFWEKLPRYYQALSGQLEKKGFAYQGMVYRKAAEKVGDYLAGNSDHHIFIGFNALNTAEQEIFQFMLESGRAEVFWDIDKTFYDDKQHGVSYFLRAYASQWKYYQKHPIKKFSSDFAKPKALEIIGVPKNITQAKYLGEILAQMSPEEVAKTAVVLGDEGLLLPVLNSLPSNVQEVNVTMGFSLRNAPVAFLIENLLKMHSDPEGKMYFKDVTAVVLHPLIQKISKGESLLLSEKIRKENLVYLSSEEIGEQSTDSTARLYELCFRPWRNDPKRAVDSLQDLIYLIKSKLDKNRDRISLEFLYQFHLLLNKLDNLLDRFNHIQSVKSLYSIYKDLVSGETVDLRGKPFSGLQLMGVLESRVLDFDRVILLSVNEGVLPAGKSSNSFIPFDLKCAYSLPTYKEKDAVYAYHFYHLLQRASQVYLMYNTETGGLNAGEKSRFLLQLEMERRPQHQVRRYTVVPKIPAFRLEEAEIEKTPEIMRRIAQLAEKGFSPSALTSYMRNPLDFYKQYVLGIKEQDEVEETIAYNTLGTVVHDTLEKFYKQWEGKEIKRAHLEEMLEKVPEEIQHQFQVHYAAQPLRSGKNLLILEVAIRYVQNFLRGEIAEIRNGNSIRILQVERKLESSFPMDELEFPVRLKGTVDRVDIFNGKVRIIDYKTGKVEQNKVEVVEWSDITGDYDKYSKPFQVLMYASLLNENQPLSTPVEAGIISFKNLQAGFLKFSKKDGEGRKATKDSDITQETLSAFKKELKKLILEICNPAISFKEKAIKNKVW